MTRLSIAKFLLASFYTKLSPFGKGEGEGGILKKNILIMLKNASYQSKQKLLSRLKHFSLEILSPVLTAIFAARSEGKP